MTKLAQNGFRSASADRHGENVTPRRWRSLRALFLHSDAAAIKACLEALEAAQFRVSSDAVTDLAACRERLLAESYDVLVAGHPSANYEKSQIQRLLQQTHQDIPIVLLADFVGTEPIADWPTRGAYEYVPREQIAQLPATIRRIQNERKMRWELRQLECALRHAQSCYRALVENPAHGICRCNAAGQFVEVNQALVEMLGYKCKEELLAANRASGIALHIWNRKPLDGSPQSLIQIPPMEIAWRKRDGTLLKARLSGCDAFDEQGKFIGSELIIDDITEQRAFEEQLRHQAKSDSLTGLANHRRLFEVLKAEIGRSKRTGREFSLLLLDLDGLKKINDQHGHMAGDRALFRMGKILRECCRSTDTAARHGGDEFAVVLPETGIAAATLVARRICELLEKDTEEPALLVSLGIAGYPREADSIGTLFYAADRALYAMKSRKPRLFGAEDEADLYFGASAAMQSDLPEPLEKVLVKRKHA